MAVADYDTCFHGSLVDEIIAMLMNVIALTIIIRIGVVARKRLSSDAKMHLQLEILFYIAIIAACLVQIGSILSVALCPFQGSVVQLFIFLFVVYYGFILLFACLTATLIIRLYLTFQHSAWKISRNKLIVSIFLTMVMCLIWMSAAIIRWIGWIETKMFFGLTGMGWILFMFLSVESAYYFIRNLLALAGLRGSTRDTTANAKQQKFINVSSKYMILFVMAVCTSTAVTIMSALSRITLDIHPGIGWSIDCVINVLCLYLQVNSVLFSIYTLNIY